MLKVCRVGLIAVPVLEMKLGGGVAAPGASTALRLGAGASDTDLACVEGTLPPLTKSGATSGSSASSATFDLAESADSCLPDFVGLEESPPLATASISSCN